MTQSHIRTSLPRAQMMGQNLCLFFFEEKDKLPSKIILWTHGFMYMYVRTRSSRFATYINFINEKLVCIISNIEVSFMGQDPVVAGSLMGEALAC